MNPYSRKYKGMPIQFLGTLLAAGTGKGKHNAHFPVWSDFEIFYTDKSNYFVNIVTVRRFDRSESCRGFVCNDFGEILKCLRHPAYNTLSFTAQEVYNNALDAAVEMGLIRRGEYELNAEEHFQVHDNKGVRDDDKKTELPEVYDFSED